MYRRTFLSMSATIAAAQLVGTPALAGQSQVYQSFFGVAIDGTDPTGYFTEGRPVAGKRSISLDWRGATWRFASEASREAFTANPEKYAPQYGGYCAWAVAQGYTASTDPEAWAIVDDKLYLNYSKSIQARWEQDIPGHIEAANGNWPAVLS